MEIAIVAALSENGIIGANNKLPWHLPEELKYFKALTLNKPIIMGKNTFESMQQKLLPNRHTIVITSQPQLYSHIKASNFIAVASIKAALQSVSNVATVMILGGATIYQQFLPLAHTMYLSIIKGTYAGDTYFPKYDLAEWQEVNSTDYNTFIAKIFKRTTHVRI